VGSAQKFLTRYSQEGDEFLDSIVTRGETWVYHDTPESKKKFDDDKVQEVMTSFKGQATDFYDSGIQKLFPGLNVWTMPTTMLKNKVMYRQIIHNVVYVN